MAGRLFCCCRRKHEKSNSRAIKNWTYFVDEKRYIKKLQKRWHADGLELKRYAQNRKREESPDLSCTDKKK